GGGTTGCVVAARLAESGASIAIIEAGHHVIGDDRVDIPGNFGKTLRDEVLDWRFETVPQPGLGGRKVPLPRGKALGGTSVINSMTWGRASKEEYDEISETLGNGKDWGWDDLLPHFKASETVIAPDSKAWAQEHGATFDPAFHGSSGPLRRGFVPWLGDSHVPFFKALNNLGVPTNSDSCNGNNVGVFTLATSIDPSTSKRNSSEAAYYTWQSEKIQLIDRALVHKVILGSSSEGNSPFQNTSVAVGVQYERNGRVEVLRASKEVVICAGAYETPKILELSGVGDPKRLQRLGVKPLIHLPGVGENLQDHLLVPLSFELKPGIVTGDMLLDPDFAAKELELYKETGKGQYASIHSAFSLLPIAAAVPAERAKKILDDAIKGIEAASYSDPKVRKGQDVLYGIQKKWYTDPNHGSLEFMHVPQFCAVLSSKPKPNTPYLSILSLVMHPFSRGCVHTSSSDPKRPPTIDPGYLTNRADLQLMMAAVRFAAHLSRTEPLAPMIVAQTDPLPAVLQDDAALEDYIKRNFETAHHPIGTASMMPREHGGVVGPDLKVYGVANLRVADASILPIQLSSHPQATLYAVGEKAASMILRDHGMLDRSRL
ncbi:GMC oxidoreductase, partial [Tulasnella calospora MUT 4182]